MATAKSRSINDGVFSLELHQIAVYETHEELLGRVMAACLSVPQDRINLCNQVGGVILKHYYSYIFLLLSSMTVIGYRNHLVTSR